MLRTSFRASSNGKGVLRSFRRFNSHGHGHDSHEPAKEVEINVTKIFGVAIFSGIGLMFYNNYKKGNEPIIKTSLYNNVEERPNSRSDNYLKRYQTSFIKGYIRDKGGIGQKQYNRLTEKNVPINLIPTHSGSGHTFGEGIKLGELGPRKEQVKYFAPLNN